MFIYNQTSRVNLSKMFKIWKLHWITYFQINVSLNTYGLIIMCVNLLVIEWMRFECLCKFEIRRTRNSVFFCSSGIWTGFNLIHLTHPSVQLRMIEISKKPVLFRRFANCTFLLLLYLLWFLCSLILKYKL